MKAWTVTSRGSPSQVLKLRHDLPQPQAGELKHDEIIVKVSHAPVFAPHARLMAVFPHITNAPWIPEIEFSGTITAISPTSRHLALKEGDAVFGMVDPKIYYKYNGVLAEYIVLPRSCVAIKPPTLSFAEASGLSGGVVTAIGMAEQAGLLNVKKDANGLSITSKAEGKRILITGGATGTGIAILQVMRYLVGKTGTVIATASPRSTSLVKELGADEVIDYNKYPKLHRHLTNQYTDQPFDAIIDIAGSDELLYKNSPAYLTPSGHFVFAGKISATHADPPRSPLDALFFFLGMLRMVLSWFLVTHWPRMLGGVPRRGFFHSGQPTARKLELCRQIAEDGNLRVVVDSIWSMEDALEAYKHADGPIQGKVVVKVEQ